MTLSYFFVAHDPWDERAGDRTLRSPASLDVLDGTDTPLVAAVRAGDTAAFREIFDRYAEPLLGFVTARLGSPERAEDVVQQVFASIWMQRAKWIVPTTIGAYLFRAVRNLIARDFRDRGVETRIFRIVADTARPRVSADADLGEDELRAALDRALSAMPPRPREVFLMSREQCLSYAEIADTLGVSVKTVELHMGRALAALRDALAEWRI